MAGTRHADEQQSCPVVPIGCPGDRPLQLSRTGEHRLSGLNAFEGTKPTCFNPSWFSERIIHGVCFSPAISHERELTGWKTTPRFNLDEAQIDFACADYQVP
ncbi:hypothetical protein SAMN06265222_11412 [Neorhodopirellula lusitana]|uniref:Uncharacterized protein n=1 Tax=Neorhodopirellula lusitana TaxID=445327 RepID=A0ABY1QGX4_9BACT|nr:hypothetical protein SAMN06265222_11412 [Neorhodopirellula lusitana]